MIYLRYYSRLVAAGEAERYSEKWTGTCNARGIGGRVNDDPNATFLMW